MGGHLNAYTSREQTVYYAKVRIRWERNAVISQNPRYRNHICDNVSQSATFTGLQEGCGQGIGHPQRHPPGEYNRMDKHSIFVGILSPPNL